MSAPFSRDDIEKIWRMKGDGMGAPAVAILFDVNPETIRRIWRGENYRGITKSLEEPLAPSSPTEASESLARVMLRVREGLNGSDSDNENEGGDNETQ